MEPDLPDRERLISLHSSNLFDAHCRALRRLTDGPRMLPEDPELIAESPLFVSFDPGAVPDVHWRNAPAALMPYLRHTGSPHDLSHRLVDHYEARIPSNSVLRVAAALSERPMSKKAVLPIWRETDLFNEVTAPCLNYAWFRLKQHEVDAHFVMRACDIYTKFPANAVLFSSVLRELSNSLGKAVGRLDIFIDSAHIYRIDADSVRAFIATQHAAA
ncbi:MAG: hypothetical protein KGI79_01405 [Patescibacteria group bacterium]|nr:hypothetical protein [Patescibacteria group bacterium]MDE2116515.1 hypothetical protein [Patescibacteria group bacterium]